MTIPVAISAPLTRDLTNPSRFEFRTNITFSIWTSSLPSLAETRKNNLDYCLYIVLYYLIYRHSKNHLQE
jgi:hypothetical protein